MNNKGLTLIVLIMVIVLLGIIVGGITSYISEGLRQDISNINNEKALGMAQAGIMNATVDYKDDGLWSSQSNVNVNSPSEFYYSVGDQSSFLLIDGSNIKANGRVVNTWPLKNISTAVAMSITSINVSWNFAATLNSMKIGNHYILKNGALSSPATIDNGNCYGGSIPLSITAGANYSGTNDQYIHFSVNVPDDNKTIAVTFNFNDGSSVKKYLLISNNETNNEFFIKATGKIQAGSDSETRKRTILATYDIGTSNITSWEESQNHLP